MKALVARLDGAPPERHAEPARGFEIDQEIERAMAIAVGAGEQERATDGDAPVDPGLLHRRIVRDGDGGKQEDQRGGLHTSMRPAVRTVVFGASSCAASTATFGSSGSSSERR